MGQCSGFVPPTNGTGGGGGGGGGDVGPGTINQIAKFTAADAVGDSSISDDGNDVDVAANLNVTGGNALAVSGSSTLTGAVVAEGTFESIGVTELATGGGNTTVGGNLLANNALTLLYQVHVQGYFARQSAMTPAALPAGTTQDYDLNPGLAGSGRIRQATNVANSALGGLVPNGVGGYETILINLGPGTLTLNHEDGGSTPANRFALEGAANRVIAVNGAVLLSYDNGSARWYMVG